MTVAHSTFHRGPSRRHVLTAGALAAGGVAATTALGSSTPAHAAPSTPPAIAFGTPTDLARRRSDTVWTRESDGSVWTFDRRAGHWTLAAEQRWDTVLTYGTAVIARWAQPRGATSSVLVFGTAPSKPTPPPTPPPTTPPTPGGGGHGSTPGAGSGSGGAGTGAAAGNGTGYDHLPQTGFDAWGWGVLGAAAVLVGGLVNRFGRRSTGEVSSD